MYIRTQRALAVGVSEEVDSRAKSNEHRLDEHDEVIKEMRDD